MVVPKIGLSMLYCLGESFKKMTDQIPKEHIKHIEIVDDGYHALDSKRAGMLKDIGESYNLEFSVHAPFAGINIALHSRPLLNAALRRLKESIINASDLGCKLWVFHPGMKTGISMFYPGADWTRNLQNIKMLSRFARDRGVDVAVENVAGFFLMRTVEEFKRFYDEIDEKIGLALDTGHANIIGQVESFLTELPARTTHIHAHDNDAKSDQHLGVGYGTIDWKGFAALLKQASYNRAIIVESFEHVDESVRKLRQLLA